MIWYVRRGEREIGPLGEDALRALVGTGQVIVDTPLWREGLPGWTPAGTLPGVLGPKATAAARGPHPATPRARIGPHYWATAAMLLVATAALLALLPQAQRARARHTLTSAPTSNLQRELTRAANGVNASTPRMIDDMTRLDGAQAGPGTLFTYDYTLSNISASRLSPPSLQMLRQRLSADVRQTVCEGAALQPLLHMGAVIRFHYRDRDGQDLVLTSVSSAECTR